MQEVAGKLPKANWSLLPSGSFSAKGTKKTFYALSGVAALILMLGFFIVFQDGATVIDYCVAVILAIILSLIVWKVQTENKLVAVRDTSNFNLQFVDGYLQYKMGGQPVIVLPSALGDISFTSSGKTNTAVKIAVDSNLVYTIHQEKVEYLEFAMTNEDFAAFQKFMEIL